MAKKLSPVWSLLLQVWHRIEAYNQRRVSMAELAELSGVSRQYLYDLMHAKIVPTDEKIAQLAKAWGVTQTVLRAKVGA